MYYGTIKKTDIANGLGVRVSLFVSGCRNHCKGCHNQITWDFKFGNIFTEMTEMEILEALAPSYIDGLTVLGGEPFEEENQEVLAPFLETVKKAFPKKNIWCYTGYLYDKDLLPADGRKHTAFTNRMLACIDVLVDGPYIESQRDLTLNFRGSRNQRIIDLEHNCLMKL
ncbi:MAG: anaerobic ribonucleoside-triphosphate reductase activating protein [Treponema sp.]|uniref:anaerobic ribonucleoside-triphosphate reductase activating protein n=1 Tax=Treponema sp. TaxID=166 RepID=UPI001B0E78DB|nr:anaerobic ribonucleoside-triphosphate reductase activating protein [Treponema sp.]MBO6220243.1 anaerobic ribonucleoside-triphosphate reductase activating protein [Treponema sp.]MBQ8678288.1 anaerobic ribonucleoside-triphosphate reductase activating protein [Treponema sp.]